MDLELLDRKYKQLQWTFHPDKAVNRSPEEQALSLKGATVINMAYSVLKKPLSRATYMVS